jgi:hypothetical protein
MSDSSTKDQRQKLHYTSQERLHYLRFKELRRKRQGRLPENIRQAERALSLTVSGSMDSAQYQAYLQTLSPLPGVLSNHALPPVQNASFYLQPERRHPLVKKLSATFGKDAVYVFGNYSNPNVRFHAPARGIGLRLLLRKHGIRVIMIDEFRKSSFCFECRNRVAPFLKVVNHTQEATVPNISLSRTASLL